MCEYCKEGNGVGKALLHDENFESLYIVILNGMLWDKTYDCGIEINYCPMCGKKLKENEEITLNEMNNKIRTVFDKYKTVIKKEELEKAFEKYQNKLYGIQRGEKDEKI